METLKIIIGLFIFVNFCVVDTYANIADSLVVKTRNYIGLNIGQYSSSSYFEFDGNEYATVLDSLDNRHNEEYSFNLKKYILSFDFSQSIFSTPEFTLFAKINVPYSINDLETKYSARQDSLLHNDSIPDIVYVYDNSNIPYIDFGIGTDYKLNDFYFGLGLNYKLSLLSNIDDSKGVQVFDRYYSNFSPYISVLYRSEKSYYELHSEYQVFQDSPLSDVFKLRFALGISTVESSVLGVYAQYSKSINTIDEGIKFNPYYYQNQFESITLGVHFDILIEKFFLPSISYNLQLSGKNTPNISVLTLSTKFLLDFAK